MHAKFDDRDQHHHHPHGALPQQQNWTHPGWPIGILLVILSVFFFVLMSEINNLLPDGPIRLVIPLIGTMISLFAVLLYAYRAYHRNQGGWIWQLCARYCSCLGFCCRAVDGVFAKEGYQVVSDEVSISRTQPTTETVIAIVPIPPSPLSNVIVAIQPPVTTVSIAKPQLVTAPPPPTTVKNEQPVATASASHVQPNSQPVRARGHVEQASDSSGSDEE